MILTDHPALVALADALRIVCAAGAAGLTGSALVLSWRLTRRTEQARAVFADPAAARDVVGVLVGLAVFALAALLREYWRIGEPVTVLLPLHVIAVAAALTYSLRLVGRLRCAGRRS
jgi:hypothetical protein